MINNELTFVQTPGLLALPHPSPHEVTPTRIGCSSNTQINGPPESPWHASFYNFQIFEK